MREPIDQLNFDAYVEAVSRMATLTYLAERRAQWAKEKAVFDYDKRAHDEKAAIYRAEIFRIEALMVGVGVDRAELARCMAMLSSHFNKDVGAEVK